MFQVVIQFPHALLVCHAVPDAVAGNEYVLVGRVTRSDGHIRQGSHSLLLLLQKAIIFELVVAESATQGQLAVDPVHKHCMTCLLNSHQFTGIIRFMVLTEGNSPIASLSKNSSTVAGIGTKYPVLGDEDDVSRATGIHGK